MTARSAVKPAPYWLLAGLFLAVTAAWAYAVFVIDLDYWYHDNEFAELTMGYALNIDQWLTGSIGKGRRSIFNNYLSPAMPHQVAAWLAYRLSDGFNFRQATDLAVATLGDPRAFFLFQRIVVLGFMLLALYRFFRLARPLGLAAALAVTASLLCYTSTWEYGVHFLSDPSMAPIVAALFFLALLKTLGQREGLARPGAWIWLGFTGILAYSLKMHYAAWLLAAGGGLMAGLILGRFTWRQAGIATLWVLLGMGLGLELLAFLLDGKFTHHDILKMFAFHFDIVMGQETKNLPGGGAEQAFAQTVSLDVFVPLALFALLSAGMAFSLFQRRQDAVFIRHHAPVAVTLFLAYAAGLIIFLKFPSLKYLVSSAVLLPAGVYWLLSMEESVRWRGGLCAALSALAMVAAVQQIGIEKERKSLETVLRGERERILELPLAENEFRLWAYRVVMPEYNIRLAVQWGGDRSLDARVGDQVLPRDREYNVWRDMVRIDRDWRNINDTSWRHAVLPGRLDEENLPGPFRGFGHKIAHFGDVSVITSNRP
ncbi:MAG: hypothetical protein EPN26_01570 [Rhodospirillales bacterium]|nr:MAG: hypothetical protein EPN26_01570 [Rhodospirillales bacterium]